MLSDAIVTPTRHLSGTASRYGRLGKWRKERTNDRDGTVRYRQASGGTAEDLAPLTCLGSTVLLVVLALGAAHRHVWALTVISGLLALSFGFAACTWIRKRYRGRQSAETARTARRSHALIVVPNVRLIAPSLEEDAGRLRMAVLLREPECRQPMGPPYIRICTGTEKHANHVGVAALGGEHQRRA